jgi:hypothetical protein
LSFGLPFFSSLLGFIMSAIAFSRNVCSRFAGSFALSFSVVAATAFAQSSVGLSEGHVSSRTMPAIVTSRGMERTGFQESGDMTPRIDLRTDFVMVYGIGPTTAEKLKHWIEAGYVPQLMTGVAWGDYTDYLDGKVDGRQHWDESQVDAAGKPVMHGERCPYMVPTIAFSKYLEAGIQRAIDAGAVAIHLEEPEFWAFSGFSEAFQREWQIHYNEPWQRPDSSCDAQYRASKLKYYLYRRALDRLCAAMKEYALVKHHRPVRFYVPTHSLLSYTQISMVSPESSLIDTPGVDGYIAQVWTGTARQPNTYQGRLAERTFESAFLEYGVMQELVRGTNRRMWFLHDPVEDDPKHDWNDYQSNYIATLVASLFQPDVCRYEVAPWPRRVMNGKYPQGSPDAKGIGDDYATTLAVAMNQLRDMDQKDVAWEAGTDGVGVFLADSAMFQRAEPAFTAGVVAKPDDPTRATREEVQRLSGFFGMAMPLVKHGIPIRPVQLDNVIRSPGYLDSYKVLLLSYEFMKPMQPTIHQALVEWVSRGGTLIYVGADTDPFHQVREWWNQASTVYAAPSEHLFERLGLGRSPAEGEHSVGKGLVIVERKHPAWFSRSAEGSNRVLQLVKRGTEAAGGKFLERNSLLLRRGPYVIAATLNDSVGNEPLRIGGRMVDLLDPNLPVRDDFVLPPGKQAWLLDLDRVTAPAPAALAAAGRIETWSPATNSLTYQITSPEGVNAVARILLPAAPKNVAVDGQPCTTHEWHEASKTVLIRHPGHPKPVQVHIEW